MFTLFQTVYDYESWECKRLKSLEPTIPPTVAIMSSLVRRASSGRFLHLRVMSSICFVVRNGMALRKAIALLSSSTRSPRPSSTAVATSGCGHPFEISKRALPHSVASAPQIILKFGNDRTIVQSFAMIFELFPTIHTEFIGNSSLNSRRSIGRL